MVGCWPTPAIPDEQRVPLVAGVVERRADGPGPSHTFVLEGGREFTTDDWTALSIVGGLAADGDLLLAGGAGPDAWVASLGPSASDPECFELWAMGEDDDGDVATSLGILLPKSSEFDPGLGRDGQYSVANTHFCVDRSGRLTSYGR